MATPWGAGGAAADKIRKADPNKLDALHLDGLVVLKIIKHAHENWPDEVNGSLLGLDIGTTLEVTNSFPYPQPMEDAEGQLLDGQMEADEYQMEMMKMLREVNVDNNIVGWYQCSFLGSFCTADLVETQFSYQQDLGPKMCVLIYDPLQTMRGNLSLKAFRLTDTFMKTFAKFNGTKFTQEMLADAQLNSSKILEEIPIRIHNSPLTKALMLELREQQAQTFEFDRLDISTNPYIEKHLVDLIDCVGQLTAEQAKFQRYERDLVRQKQNRSNWLQERRLENAKRKEAGEELLPEEEPNNPLFKPVLEPSRLQSLLMSKQITTYCKQVNFFSGNSFSKLFLAGSLHKD